jgi:hypothetical protein
MLFHGKGELQMCTDSPDQYQLSRSEKEDLLRMADPSQLTPGYKSYRTKLLQADELSARAKKAWQTRRKTARKAKRK